MTDVTSIPTGSLPRDAALQVFRPLAAGTSHPDPTKLFSQLKGMGPLDPMTADIDALNGVLDTTPDRMSFILLANGLTVPLTVHGTPYFDCGAQYVAPAGNAIPAATPDDIQYGLFSFGSKPGGFYGTEGAFQIEAQGTTLPNGLTIGWRVSAAQLAWQTLTFAGGVSLQQVSSLEHWCDKYIDASSTHRGTETANGVRTSWAVFEIANKGGYTFMTVLVEAAA